MKIESILNQSTGLGPGAESKGDRTSPSGPKNGPEGPYFSLPTPSPECAPSKTASGQPDSRTRTPWDAGGYSLPREPSSNTSSRSSFAFLSPRDHRDTARPTDASNDSNYHSRRMSMETSTTAVSPGVATPYSLPVRMHSIPDVQQDSWTSTHVWTDYNVTPGTGNHKVSDSRSSFSSCCSSTFSAGHSRISSISTINGSHQLGSGIADLEAKLERLPRLTAPPPPAAPTPSPKPEAQLPRAVGATSARALSSSSPSDSLLEARMMKRRRGHLSQDQSNFKPRDHFLHSLDRVHKRTISAPNPPQSSASAFTRIPTTLPSLASGHFEATLSPSPRLNIAHQRAGSEHNQWCRLEEISPAASMATRSPSREIHDNERAMSANDIQAASRGAMPQAGPNDRVLTACRRFRKVEVNKPLEGGDICMAVENCTTGSVPRKVISHLFGRNKVCTRRIPERVWVCMCRKHYQRMRYRKGADFSVTQIGMVYEQIVRMIFWSRGLESANRVNQEAITIRSWTFSIRKRELKRLVDTNGRDLVPRWIVQSLGDGKTHDEILDIVERLHHEIQQGILKDVPPVEFLPEVVDAYTNVPAQLSTHINRESSNEVDVSAINRSGRLGQLGEATESPISFVKDSSPLEPVQEEGSMSERSSEAFSSPTPPATFDDRQYGLRPGHHNQQQADDAHSHTANYAFGARSPLVDPGMTAFADRRGSVPYYDSQNPTQPSLNHFGINYQLQAPASDPRGSHDSMFHAPGTYAGGGQRGPTDFVLIDRPSSYLNTSEIMPQGGYEMHPAGYGNLGTREAHGLYGTPGEYQTPPIYFNHPQRVAPARAQEDERYYHQDALLLLSISEEPSTAYQQPLEAQDLAWYHGEAGSNVSAGRTVNQAPWQSAAHGYEDGSPGLRQRSGNYSPDREATVSHSTGCHPQHRGMVGFDDNHSRGHHSGYQPDEPIGDDE
ncbi:hypothetical protein MRS44_007731 [Fusarium solani]|uniref:uncharacterized protein n=1 Tax=Fusarium solani TaxID=169388 RepID=UPI0032C3F963|nr:hypothetical protein MRS44_007731 [Fusarium solani]